ncbi:MAG: pyridoxine 5'-phosphate synthase [Rhodothermales bacterium]|nr:pyridoxine 5'-phosphate synthase [Rhodothermales bacterium]
MTPNAVLEPTHLLINVDHVATLRNARQARFPDPVHAAVLAEKAGADGIVFHPREDRRHITDRDVRLLKETVTTKLDFELSTNEEVVAFCCEIRPHLATLVPERRQEITTEGGLDVRAHRSRLQIVTRRLFDAGIEEVAYFVDPVLGQIDACADAGASCIELHTGDYANAGTVKTRVAQADRLAAASIHAHTLGLRVHAGHGLDYQNYALFKHTVPHIHEVSIGFAIVARALLVGFEEAVREMLRVVKG